jgi:hypothetical protein
MRRRPLPILLPAQSTPALHAGRSLLRRVRCAARKAKSSTGSDRISNAQNCCGQGASSRGNNPDGIWIADGLNNGRAVQINFSSGFVNSLTSFSFDVAGYAPTT